MPYDVNQDMNWLRRKEPELIQSYRDQFILVREQKVVDSFRRRDDALSNGNKMFGEENFLVFHLVRDDFMEVFDREERALLGDIDFDQLEDDDED